MKYYSTNHRSATVSLADAVTKGMAPDGGLYLPECIHRLPNAFIRNMTAMSLQEMGYAIANFALGGDVDSSVLHDIVYETLNFPIPLHQVDDNRYTLELFHGPTMAYKDVGARFMARLLAYYHNLNPHTSTVNVLVPTSGDTGGAVANGFIDVPGVNVYVLYPQDGVSYIQEAQFASLGHNVTALEVKGTFDDCKYMVEQAFMDEDLNRRMILTSGTSINVARLLPQTFYYFYAYTQLLKINRYAGEVVISVPSANLGNLASGVIARAMGLPIKRLVSVENVNNIFYHYLQTGEFLPRPSVYSIAPALDAGNPTNFARITALLGDVEQIRNVIHGYSFSDEEILDTITRVFEQHRYVFDPHSAIAWRGLEADLQPGETGISLATAHPAKFSEAVETAIHQNVEMPLQLVRFLRGTRHVTSINSGYTALRNYLLSADKE